MFTTEVHRRTSIVMGVAALVAGLSACGGGANPSALNTTPEMNTAPKTPTTALASSSSASADATRPVLTTGRRVAALDFNAAPSPSIQTKSTGTEINARGADTAAEATTKLLRALIDGRYDGAWSMLSPIEQERIGFKERMASDVVAAGWTAFTITSSTETAVVAEIRQTPKVSDIDGIVAASATVTFPTVNDNGVYTVSWSRRTVNQNLPERSKTSDEKVVATVGAWAAERQKCSKGGAEYSGGLIGVIGLADQLCNTTTAPTVSDVGDLDTLDEPQPIIDGFGGSALRWARVVTLKEPIAMNVVLAPNGPDWTVIAIARPSLAST